MLEIILFNYLPVFLWPVLLTTNVECFPWPLPSNSESTCLSSWKAAAFFSWTEVIFPLQKLVWNSAGASPRLILFRRCFRHIHLCSGFMLTVVQVEGHSLSHRTYNSVLIPNIEKTLRPNSCFYIAHHLARPLRFEWSGHFAVWCGSNLSQIRYLFSLEK